MDLAQKTIGSTTLYSQWKIVFNPLGYTQMAIFGELIELHKKTTLLGRVY